MAVGLAGEHQRTNASLAIALAGAFDAWTASALGRPDAAARAASLSAGELPDAYAAGLSACTWHGRAEVVHDVPDGRGADAPGGGLSFYLDGAHTPESAATCAHWFAEAAAGAPPPGGAAPPSSSSDVRLLLFNCTHEREPRRLLAPLAETLAARGAPLAGALFVPPDSTYAKLGPGDPTADLSWQQSLAALWQADFAPAAAARAVRSVGWGWGRVLRPLPPPYRHSPSLLSLLFPLSAHRQTAPRPRTRRRRRPRRRRGRAQRQVGTQVAAQRDTRAPRRAAARAGDGVAVPGGRRVAALGAGRAVKESDLGL